MDSEKKEVASEAEIEEVSEVEKEAVSEAEKEAASEVVSEVETEDKVVAAVVVTVTLTGVVVAEARTNNTYKS